MQRQLDGLLCHTYLRFLCLFSVSRISGPAPSGLFSTVFCMRRQAFVGRKIEISVPRSTIPGNSMWMLEGGNHCDCFPIIWDAALKSS